LPHTAASARPAQQNRFSADRKLWEREKRQRAEAAKARQAEFKAQREAKQKKTEDRLDKRRKLSKRNKRGQPFLSHHISHILDKLEKDYKGKAQGSISLLS